MAKHLELNYTMFQDPNHNNRPLGTFESMVTMSVAYLVGISILSALFASRRNPDPKLARPMDIKYLSAVHNLIMAVYSFYSAVGSTSVFYNNWARTKFDPFIPFCDRNHVLYQDMDYWYYTFYLSKFAEFVDTVFLILRAKAVMPPSNSQYFLHVFHHATTASIVWVAWRLPFTAAWTGPVTNSIIHVFMYSYYFLTELGMNRKWGGIFITPIQILQFIFCLAIVSYEAVFPTYCKSNFFSIYWVLFCYLVFLGFFIKLFLVKGEERKKGSQPSRRETKKD